MRRLWCPGGYVLGKGLGRPGQGAGRARGAAGPRRGSRMIRVTEIRATPSTLPEAPEVVARDPVQPVDPVATVRALMEPQDATLRAS